MRVFAAVLLASFSWGWLVHLGGPGLILIGLVDNSVIPIPGGIDLLTIVLAASRKDLWWYYALMATVGSVIGAYGSYRLGEKGGEETLRKKVPKAEVERVYRIFKKFGFWAIFVPALCPPPVPIVPFTIAPGILKYSRKRFLMAIGSARLIRYTLVAYLGSRYGGGVFHWLSQYYKPVLIILIVLGFAAGGVAIWYVKKRKKVRAQNKEAGAQTESRVA
jgi:membrane protein YqaA with SNARE-associated domain